MPQSFARKMGLTAALLGCSTRKELCARFRTLNPATEFDLERSFKWLQGRALPRSPAVYDDWARLLGTSRSGSWLGACSTEAFLDEVTPLFGADREDLKTRAARFLGNGKSREQPEDVVLGNFVAYSWAWSPYHTGKLVRGHFSLRPGQRDRLNARYHEDLPGGSVQLTGSALHDGRFLHTHLEAQRGEHLSLSLLVPGRPASVLGGRMHGSTIGGTNIEISTTRVVMLRVAELPDATGNCYVSGHPEALANDLAAHDFQPPKAGDLALAVLQFLTAPEGSGPVKITLADLGKLVEEVQLR